MASTGVRLAAASAILVRGLTHLQLYSDGDRKLADGNLGRSFLAGGVSSVIVAAVLAVRRDALVRLAC